MCNIGKIESMLSVHALIFASGSNFFPKVCAHVVLICASILIILSRPAVVACLGFLWKTEATDLAVLLRSILLPYCTPLGVQEHHYGLHQI